MCIRDRFYTIDSLLAGNIPLFLEVLSHLALPAFVLGWAVTGIITRLVRSPLIEGLSQHSPPTPRVVLGHPLQLVSLPPLRSPPLPRTPVVRALV